MKSIKVQLWYGVLGLGLFVGLLTVYKVFTVGFVLYAKTDILVWTLPVASYVFFSLTSTGLAFVSSIPVVFGLRRYRPVEKRTALLEIAVLLAGFTCLLLHLGSPWNAIYFALSPNLASPLWWLALLYSIYFVILVISFARMQAGGPSKAMGLAVFAIAIATATTLGWLFGLPDARPVFNTQFLTMYLPLTGFASALAAVILVHMAYHRFTGTPASEGQVALYEDLAKLFGGVVGANLIFFLWRSLSGGVSASGLEFAGFRHTMGSVWYQLALWVGLVIPLVMMTVASIRTTHWGKATASSLFLVGMLAGRLEFVLSGLVMPTGPKAEGQPQFVSYWPTIWEVFVVVFALAVLLIVYTYGERHLKLDAVHEP